MTKPTKVALDWMFYTDRAVVARKLEPSRRVVRLVARENDDVIVSWRHVIVKVLAVPTLD